MTRPDPEIVRQYLLGRLSQDQGQALEQAYFGDDQAFEDILAVEGDLAADYAAGALSPDDRDRFEARMATDPELARQVGLTRGLAELAHRAPATAGATAASPETAAEGRAVDRPAPARAGAPRRGPVGRALRWLWPPEARWGRLAGAGAAALVLIVGGTLLLRPPSSAPPAGPPLLAQLTPDGLRSGSRPAALHVDTHRPVRLSLAVEDEPFSHFSVQVSHGPRRVAEVDSTAPSADGLLRVDLGSRRAGARPLPGRGRRPDPRPRAHPGGLLHPRRAALSRI